jgi:hypothetical protein
MSKYKMQVPSFLSKQEIFKEVMIADGSETTVGRSTCRQN